MHAADHLEQTIAEKALDPIGFSPVKPETFSIVGSNAVLPIVLSVAFDHPAELRIDELGRSAAKHAHLQDGAVKRFVGIEVPVTCLRYPVRF
jgi:hypothetical protein